MVPVAPERLGDVFLKIDTDQTRTDVEVEAMAMAPIPTPEILWRKPPVLALAALPGTALGRLGEPSTASSAAWAAAGAAARMLHDAPLPPWPGESLDEIASHLDSECEWLVTNGVLPTDMVTRNRRIAEAALRPWAPVFTHGDLQITHVFVDGDDITGVIDWSEAVLGSEQSGWTTGTIGGGVHAVDPASVQIHFATIDGGVDIHGESGPFGPPFDVTWNTIEDSVIHGHVRVVGYDGFWMGFIRNHVYGTVTMRDNTLADPDGNEYVTNTIHGSFRCWGNSPAPQVGDSEGELNVVTGQASGQCEGL